MCCSNYTAIMDSLCLNNAARRSPSFSWFTNMTLTTALNHKSKTEYCVCVYMCEPGRIRMGGGLPDMSLCEREENVPVKMSSTPVWWGGRAKRRPWPNDSFLFCLMFPRLKTLLLHICYFNAPLKEITVSAISQYCDCVSTQDWTFLSNPGCCSLQYVQDFLVVLVFVWSVLFVKYDRVQWH